MGNMRAAKAEYGTANIAVWWDMNDCPVPEGYDARRVRPSLEAAFKKLGYSGPVSITAYGDQKQTPGHLLRDLSSSGVSVAHSLTKNICSAMFSDMREWRGHNPPPATMMIISDHLEDVLCWDLARLQQETKYNLFRASSFSSNYGSTLVTSATWVWQSLLESGDETRSLACSDLSGSFYCKSCSFDCQSLASFKKHLSCTKHGVEELGNSGNGELDPVTRMWGMNYPAKPEYATAPIMVWWDMADCPVPEGYDPRWVRPSIEAEFKKLGYSGPVSITAFGDQKQTPDHLLRELSSTGVSVAHIIPEKIWDRMYWNIREWRDDNPPPATMMIISNDVEEGYSHSLVRRQQDTKYNLFLAYSFRPYKMSILVTSAEWLWDHLLGVSETMGQVVRKCNESGESTGMLSRGQVVHLCSESGESTGMLSSGQVVRMCSESGESTGMLSRGQVLRKCSESGESTGMLSGGHVLRKCSESGESTGMFYCQSCYWDCKGLDDFRKHFSSEDHIREEARMYSQMRLSKQEQKEGRKGYYLSKRKRLRKAPRTGFGRFHNHLSVTTT